MSIGASKVGAAKISPTGRSLRVFRQIAASLKLEIPAAFQLLVGGILLAAAFLKGLDLAWSADSRHVLSVEFSLRGLAVLAEAGLGSWLLTRTKRYSAWLSTVAMFIVFASYSLVLAVHGSRS